MRLRTLRDERVEANHLPHELDSRDDGEQECGALPGVPAGQHDRQGRLEVPLDGVAKDGHGLRV